MYVLTGFPHAFVGATARSRPLEELDLQGQGTENTNPLSCKVMQHGPAARLVPKILGIAKPHFFQQAFQAVHLGAPNL